MLEANHEQLREGENIRRYAWNLINIIELIHMNVPNIPILC